MTKTIHVLSDLAINQIAAGEVVEGPASVVKELVENAVDAGASRISIDIIGGGHFLIEVSDNGKGMVREDVESCIQRFATSKISSLEDLDSLTSMGFRGEALAAISSVSKFSITSSTGSVATVLESSGGKNLVLSNAARGQGTTVRVESLFYNTPARKKFQKARGPSTTEIVKCITKLSLCHKEIAFYLTVDGALVFSVERSNTNRIYEVLGKDFFSPPILVSYEKAGLKIEGVIGSSFQSRSNRMGQFLVVNRRSVYSLLISNAVSSGFGTALGKGEFPLFFLDMTFDPSKIDVNVHPQKKEIRFQEEEHVYALVREAIASALTGSFGISGQSPVFDRPQVQTFFKKFTYAEKAPSAAATYKAHVFNTRDFEERGFLTVKLLWDELCVVEVIAPHPQFSFIQQKGHVLIDLSILEKAKTPHASLFIGQKLLESEEIFLTQDDLATCQLKKENFLDLGMKFSIGDYSVMLLEMPEIMGKDRRDLFMHALALFQSGEELIHLKERIYTRVLSKKKYSIDEAIILIESTDSDSVGREITKNELRGLCKEYTT